MTTEELERLLSKYIAVWIWSILFTANGALIYTLAQYRPDRWGKLGFSLLFAAFFSIIFVLASLLHLLTYLIKHLLPMVFQFSAPEPNHEKSHSYLGRACRYFVIALIFRAGMTIADMILSNLQGL